jgi:hypothetical protein
MEPSASQYSYSRRASSSALSHFSARHSILSKEGSQRSVLRPSTVKDCSKDVIVWTPVVLEKDFPAIVKRNKIHYQTNTHINAQSFPEPNELPASEARVFRLPLVDIEDYLKKHLATESFLSDEELLDYLNS